MNCECGDSLDGTDCELCRAYARIQKLEEALREFVSAMDAEEADVSLDLWSAETKARAALGEKE